MKSKLVIVPVLAALVFGPALSAFAETPEAYSKTEQVEKGQKGKMDKEGEKNKGLNFCKNISELEAKLTAKAGEKGDKMMEKRDEKKNVFDQKREELATKKTLTRAQHDAEFAKKVKEMEVKMTNVDPAKIQEFQDQMMAAIGERREKVDAEMNKFVAEMALVKSGKSEEVKKALETLKTDIATATTKAKEACGKEGADSVAIAASFKVDMKAAHDKFKTTVSTLKDGSVKATREEHKAEVGKIRTESEQEIKGLRAFWKNFFGKKAPKTTEAPVQ